MCQGRVEGGVGIMFDRTNQTQTKTAFLQAFAETNNESQRRGKVADSEDRG